MKYTQNTLDKIESIIEQGGYVIRYEKGTFQSGYCILQDKKVVVLNKFFQTEGRINTLIDLLPHLFGSAPVVSRKLFWRYKANTQAAVRDGDFKYLKIRGNTFLFNVVDDPMERANLKERRKDIYDRLVADWNAWNATMLPIVADSSTGFFRASEYADHIGAE